MQGRYHHVALAAQTENRNVVFISKATPEDDEFVLWLAPKLEAAGYKVFADIRVLEGGDRWRKIITATLQDRAVKMLLCCRDTTLAKDGVQEEIGIAGDLVKSLKDKRFIIPLRLEPYRKLFGIGELQYIDFVRGWAEGLDNLLESLERQKVPQDPNAVAISLNWEAFRCRGAVAIKQEPERLTSNWLRVVEAPDVIRYMVPRGAMPEAMLKRIKDTSRYPIERYGAGFFTFAAVPDFTEEFATFGGFETKFEIPFTQFCEQGARALNLRHKEATNFVISMLRKAWENCCRERGLRERKYSSAIGFHIGKGQTAIGGKVPWGKQGERRSSMLRNIAKGHGWEFGVTGLPALWPFPHLKLKSRVLFSPIEHDEMGEPYDDAKKQHRLRRSVCKGWRNKQWYGRMLAFLEVLAQDSAYIQLAVGPNTAFKLEAAPVLFTSPVSTELPNEMGEDFEEADESTLGRPEPEEEP